MINAWISPDILNKSISSVTALVDEAEIRFEAGGMRIETVEAANVGAISLDLLQEAFYSYNCDGETICVDLARMEEILSKTTMQGNYLIEKDDDSHRMVLSNGGYEFKLSLLDPGSVRRGPDPINFDNPASVKMEADQFTEAIRVAAMFSDHIRMGFDTNNDIFFMNAKGDNDDMHLNFGKEDVEEMSVAKAYGNYSLNYLEDIRKAIPASAMVRLGIGEELPLTIQYSIANENGRINFGLAPRI